MKVARNITLHSSVAVGVLLMSLLPAKLLAQSNEVQSSTNAAQPIAADSEAGDIIVTAQFRSQRLQDTPIAITAVSGATLEARNQTSVTDIGAFAPNVNLTPAAAISANSVAAFIRGIGQESSSFALEPGVGIYVDDVYYGTTFGANLDLTDLDRVEVLRGPQGTLAGKNSLGGAIKLFSKKPDDQGGGFMEATYGRYNRIDLRASADFTIADGLYARVSGVHKQSKGFFKELDFGCVDPGQGIPASGTGNKNCVNGTEGGQDVTAIRAALRYAPTGSPLEINFVADVSRDSSETVPTKVTYASNPNVRSYVAGDPLAGIPFDGRFITGAHSYSNYSDYSAGGNYTTSFGVPTQVTPGTFPDGPRNTANSYGFSGTIDYQLADNLSVKSITAWRKAYGTTVLDIDGSPLDIIKERLGQNHKQVSEELRLTGKVGTFADFTVGGFYYKANDFDNFRIQIPTLLYDFITGDPVHNRSEAVFANVELHPLENLNIIGGIRYTNDRKTYTFHRGNPDGSAISGIPLTMNFLVYGLDGLSDTFKGDRVDYRLGLNYRFSNALMAYAQVSTGYKGGGVNPQPFVPDQVLPFNPETLTTYEAGFKSDLFDRLIRANGAIFYNQYKNIQRVIYVCAFSVSTSCGLTTNGGNGHSKGAELELSLHPVGGFSIDSTLAYLDFDYTKINPATGILSGMTAPFVNKWQASSGVQYVADLGGSGTVTPRLDWSYQSSFYYQAINSPLSRIAGRSIFNGRISYESADKNWLVSASVTNLFNKFYYIAASENVASFGLSANVAGRPREWGLTVRRRF